MAESILFDIATEVLKKIGSLVRREVSLLWNLESDLESLEGTLSRIKAVLLDAEKKQAHNHQLRDWLGKLKDVLLDAEDVLEEFEFKASGREVVRQKRSTFRKVCQCFSSSKSVGFRYEISHKIKEIRERLDKIAGDRRDFTLSEGTPAEDGHVIPKEREITDPFLGAPYVLLQASADTLKYMRIEWIERLTSLKELKITDCPALIESIRNDESKIAHVPLVRLI
ncbi:hypothetical protein Pint_16993 [Pistacia integerrima]|uniref:Uncharacterized protein n=1 Tax=Pistacia integerrima TaxID=434235 RepID=A0ACC0ZG96_9ROSI|nr:hypothetical protein Pint_16993 [Pistacia integerrima]